MNTRYVEEKPNAVIKFYQISDSLFKLNNLKYTKVK